MAGNVVNLNRFRKAKAKDAKTKQAEINRVRHGRTGAQKERELADQQRATRELDGKRLEPGDDGIVDDEQGRVASSPTKELDHEREP